MAIFDKISKTITSTSKDVAKKTKDLTETAKLNSLINSEQKKIEEIQLQIGKIYYNEYKDTALQNLLPLCNEVDDSYEKIETYETQIVEIKGIIPCPNCGEELSNESSFCSKCGTNVKSYIEEQKSKTSNTPKCPNCQTEISEEMDFCTECGYSLKENIQRSENEIEQQDTQDKATCPNCQTEISENMDFCTECGTKLK